MVADSVERCWSSTSTRPPRSAAGCCSGAASWLAPSGAPMASIHEQFLDNDLRETQHVLRQIDAQVGGGDGQLPS